MGLRNKLASQSTIMFSIRVAGAGVAFMIQAAIVHLWGSGAVADYLLANAVINVMAIMMPLGLQTTGALFAAEYASVQNGYKLRAFARLAYGVVIFPGIAIAVLAGPLLPGWGDIGAHLAPLWWQICIMSFATAIYFINAGILVGLKLPLPGILADIVFRPVLLLVGLAATFSIVNPHEAIATILWILATGYFTVVAVQFMFAWKYLHAVPAGEPFAAADIKRWFQYALPWVIVTLATDSFFDLDLVILSNLLSKDDLAIFGICVRILVLISYGVTAVYFVSVPDIVADSVRDDKHGLMNKIGAANLVATALSVILTFAVLLFSPIVFAFFGEAFAKGYIPLGILCGTMIIRAVFGPGTLVLSSRKRPYASLFPVAIGVLVLVVSNFVLLPPFGLYGAAIAALISYFTGSVLIWRAARRITGVDVSVFPALHRLLTRRN